MNLRLPPEIVRYVGLPLSIEEPPQGMASQVFIITSQLGNFVLKIAHEPAFIESLVREVSTLKALQDHFPFVAQPLTDVKTDEGHMFLFTYIEGEPLHVALQCVAPQERHHFIEHFAQTLKKIHCWTPKLPRSTDWLTATLTWLSTNILSHSSQTRITNTNSRFDGMNAHTVLAELQAQRSSIENDIVFGHYDYCLPNVLVKNCQIIGVVDWSGGGYIDRRFDLATALFSMRLAETLQDSNYQSIFLQAYGYTEPANSLYFFEALHALTCAFWR